MELTTSTSGVYHGLTFSVGMGKLVRIHVTKEGYEPYDQDVAFGGGTVRVILRRKR